MARSSLRPVPLLAFMISLWTAPLTAGWKAGAAKIEITPPHLMWMSGYGARDKPAEGKLTDLWAKALVLEDDGGKRVVLVTLDLVGIDRELSADFKRRIEAATKLSVDQVAICCSHTHTGPVVNDNLKAMYLLALDDTHWNLVQEYAAMLKEKVPAVVNAAIEDLQPAEIAWGQGTAGFAVNRRENKPEDEVPARRAAGQLKGPVDHDVPVLAVKREGRLRAVAFGYACHATVLSFYQWSGDYPGFTQMELEQRHPDCVALFWAGCGADQNPLPRREVALAQDYGRQLADTVDAVLGGELQPVYGAIEATYREIELPFAKLPAREDVDRLAASDTGYEGRRARLLLEQWTKTGRLDSAYPYPVQTWKLGSAPTWVLLGGEVVVDYALRLKREFGPAPVWVAGYVNDVMAYIPSLRVLKEGGYEGEDAMVYYGLPSKWDESIEERIVNEIRSQRQKVAH